MAGLRTDQQFKQTRALRDVMMYIPLLAARTISSLGVGRVGTLRPP